MQPFQSFQDFISHIDVPTSLYETFNRHSSVQIDVNSTDREVRRAYRQAAAALHPDNTQSQNDVELFYKLSEARDILCDTSKRERYNTELRKTRATYEDEIAKATVLYEVEKAKHFDQEQKRKKDERKAAKRSPGGNNKKKKTRDLEAKKAAEAKAKKEEEKEEAARYASIEKKVAKARAEMAAEKAAAAAEMAAAEKSTDTDDVQSMDIEEDAVVAKVLAADLAGAQPMDLSDESDTQMGEEVEDGPGMQMIDAGDDSAEDGAGQHLVVEQSYKGCGLKNIGNTCFMNSMLQLLFNLSEFNASLVQAAIYYGGKMPVIRAYLDVALRAGVFSGGEDVTVDIVDTYILKEALDSHCPNFRGKSQHDGQEYLTYLLTEMSEELDTSYQAMKMSNPGAADLNPVKKFFDLTTQDTRECTRCWNECDTDDDAQQLRPQLPSARGKSASSSSISQLLDTHFETSNRDDLLLVTCSCGCPSARVVKKQIASLPKVLLINIPRYGPKQNKLHDAVSVDERIDLSSFVPCGEDFNCEYKLDSMALHRGNYLRSGHCTSLIKTPDGWKLCDDSECTLLPRGIPRSHQKEVVFAVYRRCESLPPESNPRPISESMVKELLGNLSVPKMSEELKESNDPLDNASPALSSDSFCPPREAGPSLPVPVDEDNVEDDSPLLASFRAMCTNEVFVEDDVIDTDDDDTVICDDSDADATTYSVNAHIMTRLLHIPQKQIDLVEKYKDNEAPVVRAVITSFHTIEGILHKIEDNEIDESNRQALTDKLHSVFDEDYAKVMMDELTGIANLGQNFSKLDVKKFGVLFAFAIESSKRYKGTAPYDLMDLLNCCIMYFLRHTVYSIFLEGKTDENVLTTDMAEEFILQHATLLDFNPACCEATKDCPEGNKYPEMWRQLKNRSNQWNIEKQDAEAFWSLAGNINVDYRAVACKLATGDAFRLYVSSVRTRKQAHDNQNGNSKESDVLNVFYGTHPQSLSSGGLANSKVYGDDDIKNLAKNAQEFFSPLDGKLLSDGKTKVSVPSRVEDLVYFHKRGKRGKYEMSQKEKDAHHLAMLMLYVIPHLAPLVAKLTDDRTLENLSSDVLRADLFINHPKSKAAYIEAETRIGSKERLVSKLQSRRLTQLGTIATLQKEYRRAFNEIKETLKSDDIFSVDNVESVLDQLKLNQFGFSLYEKFLAKEDDAEELFSESLLAKMKEKYDALSANGSANIESSNNLSILQSLYRDALTENERNGGDPFSSEYFKVVEERLNNDPESATLLKEQLAKVGDDVDKLLTKMKERFDTLSANGSGTYEANFDHDLSRLQSLYRDALTENEQKDGDPFTLKHFTAVEERLKENPESATLLKEQLAKVGNDQEELLTKMKAKYDTLSSGNQYISHTSEGDVVDQIFQFHLGDLLVLTTTKGTNINVKGMNWDAYERFKNTPLPGDPTRTIGDLLGLNNVKENNLRHAIRCRAGLEQNDAGKPHLLANKPFHLLTVTVSEPGKYLVKDLGFKEGALQIWVDQYEVWKINRSKSVFKLYAEAASLEDVEALRERHLGGVVNIINRSGKGVRGAYTTDQKDYLLASFNLLKTPLIDYIISTSRGNEYQRPTREHTVELISDTLANDTTLPHSGITSVAAGVGTDARSLPKVVTGGMNRKEKLGLQLQIYVSGLFQIAVYPKSSHPLAKMMVTAICIVLNKTVEFDKMDMRIKQDTIIEILDKVRRKKLAATLSDVFPRIPTTSKISPYNDDFSEDIWSKIIDMNNVDMDLLLKRKTKSSVKEVTKSSKKRKAETKPKTEPTTKRRSSRNRRSI